jgi:hypothetical protein
MQWLKGGGFKNPYEFADAFILSGLELFLMPFLAYTCIPNWDTVCHDWDD